VKKKSTRISLNAIKIDWRRELHAHGKSREPNPNYCFETFKPIVVAFDETDTLPPEAGTELIEQVARAVLRAVFSQMTKQIVRPPSELVAGADNVARKAQELRTGINLERLLAKAQRMGVDKKLAEEWLASQYASNIDVRLVPKLLDLEITAKKIAVEQRQRLRPRDSRNKGKGPLQELLHSLFDIYAKTRSQYPGTGPDISLNASLVKFVRAVLVAANVDPGKDTHLRETVRGAFQNFRRWQLRATAYHEAGHAVIGRVLGMTCGGVTIVPDYEDRAAGHALTHLCRALDRRLGCPGSLALGVDVPRQGRNADGRP
jgi:hypothetical protein